MKTGTNKFLVKPGLYAACVELAGNPVAGGLLCQIVLRSTGKTLKDRSGSQGWLALSRLQWMTLTGFSRSQHDDAVRELKVRMLIENQRRKLKYSDPAALSWLKLTEKALSGIAEIKERKGISAFADNTSIDISALGENEAGVIYATAEGLKEMYKIQNEEIKENVFVEETTTSGADLIEEEGAEEEVRTVDQSTVCNEDDSNSKKASLKKNDKDWFDQSLAAIFSPTPYLAPEPYSANNLATLKGIKEYLDKNPGNIHRLFAHESFQFTMPIQMAVADWGDFKIFSEKIFNGYNIPPKPTLFSLKHQLKALPDFILYKNYAQTRFEMLTHYCRDFEPGETMPFLNDFVAFSSLDESDREAHLSRVERELMNRTETANEKYARQRREREAQDEVRSL